MSGRPLSSGPLNLAANDRSDPAPREIPTAIPAAESALSNLFGFFITRLMTMNPCDPEHPHEPMTRSLSSDVNDNCAAGIRNIFEAGSDDHAGMKCSVLVTKPE
jgi:hypothetical protein